MTAIRCLIASKRFARGRAANEATKPIARAIARARPRADLRQGRRRRRGPDRLGSGALSCRAPKTISRQPGGRMPRRSTDAAIGPGARILRARSVRAAILGLGLPTL